MITQSLDVTTICAVQLTEGDIIQHRLCDTWMVITEPEYTTRGITFEVLCLDVEAPNTQTVCFAPEESFVLLDNHCVMPSEYPNRFRVIAVCEEEVIVRHEAQ